MNRFSTAFFAAFAVACSGADNSGLLGDSGSQPVEDAAVQEDATAAGDVVTAADAPTGDAQHEKDATTVIDAAPDVPTGPPDSKIQCGQTTCSAQKEVCCWHQSSTTKPYECVSGPSACAGTYDVPVTCTSTDNCASQGHPSFQCCATGGNYGWGTCGSYEVASGVACKASCDFQTDWEIGCNVQNQNCSDSMQTCVVSKCTLPGVTMCY